MSSTIYLFRNFNNYYNRIIKKFDTVNDYINYINEDTVNRDYAVRGTGNDIPTTENGGFCNFNINDGVTAEITYNYDKNKTWQPDYVIVTEFGANTPSSRWFVMEAVRTRRGQYRITLRRDVISDNYNNVLIAPTFIEKATVNKNSPFIFNSENMGYNQIKKDNEILLKDETNTPWIVGYVAAPQSGEEQTDITAKYDHEVDIRTTSDIETYLSNHGYNKDNYTTDFSSWKYTVDVEGETLGILGGYRYDWYLNNQVSTTYIHPVHSIFRESDRTSVMKNATLRSFINNDVAQLTINNISAITGKNFITSSKEEELWNLQGKIIKCGNDVYQFTVAKTSVEGITYAISDLNYSSIYLGMKSVTDNFKAGSVTGIVLYNLVSPDVTRVELSYTKLDGATLEVNTSIPAQRKVLIDAPYCMFCIPYNQVQWKGKDGETRTTDPTACIAIATAIAEQLGQTKCYDLQLLPYCPRRDLIGLDGMIDLTLNSDIVVGYDFWLISNSTGLKNSLGFILWCSNSSGTINIPHNIEVPEDSLDFKVENETTFYRLCSPNYSAQYEFKATMNDGVDFFNVDYCYKPYQPYIHVNPNFKRMYGTDTNDTRGLICAGDFCLSQTTDQFKQYVINNKNYQESFNKQIETQDVLHKYDRTESIINAAVGAAGAGTAAGLASGNAGIGIAAGTLSAAAGVADVAIQERKYQINKTFSIEQFDRDMGNVKARPDTLSKVSAYNPNNKVFPFIEKWESTEEERNALRSKLYYNGMTLGIIGRISDYIREEPSFIKGKVIRLEDISDDYHMTTTIAEELDMGVFI